MGGVGCGAFFQKTIFTVWLGPRIYQTFDKKTLLKKPELCIFFYGFRKGRWRHPIIYIYEPRVVRMYTLPPPPYDQGT